MFVSLMNECAQVITQILYGFPINMRVAITLLAVHINTIKVL